MTKVKNKVENLIRERNLLVGRLNGYRRVQEVVSESRTSKVKVSADTVSGVSVLVDRIEFLNILSDSKKEAELRLGSVVFELMNDREYLKSIGEEDSLVGSVSITRDILRR